MNMLEAIADGAKVANEQRLEIGQLQARVRELEAELAEEREKIERAVEVMSRYLVKTASECEALDVLRG